MIILYFLIVLSLDIFLLYFKCNFLGNFVFFLLKIYLDFGEFLLFSRLLYRFKYGVLLCYLNDFVVFI